MQDTKEHLTLGRLRHWSLFQTKIGVLRLTFGRPASKIRRFILVKDTVSEISRGLDVG